MADPSELIVIGGSGLTIGGLVVMLLKWSGSRNIGTLDGSIQALNASVQGLTSMTHDLREKDVAKVKDVETLRAQQAEFATRLEGLAKYWRDAFEEQRRINHSRLDKATLDLVAAIEALTATKVGRKK